MNPHSLFMCCHAIWNDTIVIKSNCSIGESHVCGAPLWVACVLAISSHFTEKSIDCSFQMIVRVLPYENHNGIHTTMGTYIVRHTVHPTALPLRDFWQPQTNKGKRKKPRLLATAGYCAHPLPPTHKCVHRCVCVCRRVCGNPRDKKRGMFYFHTGLLSCLPLSGVILLPLF